MASTGADGIGTVSAYSSAGTGVWTATATVTGAVPSGSRTITATLADSDVHTGNSGTDTLQVNKREVTLTYTGDISEQYSDSASLSATLIDNSPGGSSGSAIVGRTITFTLGTQTTSAITDSTGKASVALPLSQPSATINLVSNFAGDSLYNSKTATTSFTINKEDATVKTLDDNPTAIQVASAGGNSGSFTLSVNVKELYPDIPVGGTTAAGDINRAMVLMTLEPVGPGTTIASPAICPSVVSGSGYDAVKTVKCTFTNVPVNTYTVKAEFRGNYYTGPAYEDTLTVFDPSLGFTTGGGWFLWPGTLEKTNFGYNMKYSKSGTNVQGSLLMIKHMADGSIYRIKSNAINNGLAIGSSSDTNGVYGTASFTGKATYYISKTDTNAGNQLFTVYVEDHNEPGTGVDKFWIKLTDGNNNPISAVTMPGTGVSGAQFIKGGNIVVPHTNAAVKK